MLERLPVIVGVGQITRRAEDLADTGEPLALMAEAARAAIADAGCSGLAARIDSVRVVNMLSGRYPDPAGALAARLALPTGERLYTGIGGNAPQWLANVTADDLAVGRVHAALLAGGEALHTLRRAAKQGVTLAWTRGRPAVATIGDDRFGSHPEEWKHGAQRPAQIYPLFDTALRAHERWNPQAHGRHIATLSASLAQVAAANPHAWIRDGKSADAIGTVTEHNRMVAFPYPKFMNAFIDVDQAAAVVMTTVDRARALGIPRERWVYLHGGGEAHDIWFIKDRVSFHASPGMAMAYEDALRQAGIVPSALAYVDLYSCFPVAVEMAARVLQLPSDGSQPLTVTGGLPYFGGAGNDYTMHAIATLVERLRARPGALGLVSGLGWYLTKHAVGVYGSYPPEHPWHRSATQRAARQAAIESLPHPAYASAAEGPAHIETYTVLYDRDGVAIDAIIVARLEDSRRTFANTPCDADLFAVLQSEEMVGAAGILRSGPDGRNLFRPRGG